MSDEMTEKAKQYYQVCLKLKELNDKVVKEKGFLAEENAALKKEKEEFSAQKQALELENNRFREKLAAVSSKTAGGNSVPEGMQSDAVALLEKRVFELESKVFGSAGKERDYSSFEEKFFRSKIIDTKKLMDFMKENFSEKDFNVRELTDLIDKKNVFGEVPFKELKRRMRFVVPKFSREGFIVRVEKGRYKLNKSFVGKSGHSGSDQGGSGGGGPDGDHGDSTDGSGKDRDDSADDSGNDSKQQEEKSIRAQDIIIG
ncbi:MAG: hypothetical protein J7K00_01060 [Candidatus Diapherotrites archaeon]|nr:hypothetical protein [Candidatus Diapherotrites archaeon]